MADIAVFCPECGRSFRIDESLAGRVGRCKGCGRTFSLAASGVASGASGGFQAPPSPTAVPAAVGRFQVRQRLGLGAFGAVYRAYDPSLDREVALKVPHLGTLADSSAVERFLREARAAAQLRHPNVVPIFEAGTHDGLPFIAAALIAGRTLSEHLADGPMDPREAARIARDLAGALDKAHSLGIVHRDVKPANVMIDTRGRALLMDFGLARWGSSADRLTHSGAILGTPAYMAPEQASGRSGEATAASDQYALGATLYEMLAGHPPFSGPPSVVIFHVLRTAPEPPPGSGPRSRPTSKRSA